MDEGAELLLARIVISCISFSGDEKQARVSNMHVCWLESRDFGSRVVFGENLGGMDCLWAPL